MMNSPPDELLWVQQSRILGLCDISRAALNSWIKSGLDLGEDTAAYDLSDLVTLLIFAAARKHMTPKHMVGAWTDLVRSGEATRIINAARELGSDQGFDLVVDPEYGALRVALSEGELLEAVRHPTAPRPIVVVDMAEKVRDAVSAFHRFAERGERPPARKRGRPRSASRSGLRLVSEADR
jgi:hypothetical protein